MLRMYVIYQVRYSCIVLLVTFRPCLHTQFCIYRQVFDVNYVFHLSLHYTHGHTHILLHVRINSRFSICKIYFLIILFISRLTVQIRITLVIKSDFSLSGFFQNVYTILFPFIIKGFSSLTAVMNAILKSPKDKKNLCSTKNIAKQKNYSSSERFSLWAKSKY